MPIVTVILYTVIVGLIMWLVNRFIPMAEPYKTILNVVVIVLYLLWLLGVFGLLGATVPVYPYHLRN